jgi:hypothetical protein
MNPVTKFFDRLAENYATKHKSRLIQKRQIKEYLAVRDEDFMRWAAYSAFKGTPMDVGTKEDNIYYPTPNYDVIPLETLVSLKQGTFPDYKISKTTRQQRERVQRLFLYGDTPEEADEKGRMRAGYEQLVDSHYHQKAEENLKVKWTSIAVLLAVTFAITGFGGHAYLKHRSDVKYWASINTTQTYSGDGFTQNFPCSQVSTRTDLNGPDISSSTSSCEYFGGANHEAIDNYSVEVEHFLTDKYDPANEVACGDPMHYTGSADTQVYYNETRQIDGYTWILCGTGQSSIVARLRVNNTVFTLSALPSNEKDTAADLDNMIRGFQLN